MDEGNQGESAGSRRSVVERRSERELVVTRTINGPARLVFEAWTRPELFKRWWVPREAPITLLSCELDVRTGGRYRLVFGAGEVEMAFFGRYLEVSPPLRLVWTNEEEGEEAGAVTTVTFEETAGGTRVVVHDLYPSKAALDAAIESGSTEGMPAQLAQLDELMGILAAEAP